MAVLGSDARLAGIATSLRRMPPFYWRVIVLTLVYTIGWSAIAAVTPIFWPWMHYYTLLEIVLLAAGWACAEALGGLATVFGFFMLGICGSDSLAAVQTAYFLLTSAIIHGKFGWRPSAIVWLLEASKRYRFRRLLSESSAGIVKKL